MKLHLLSLMFLIGCATAPKPAAPKVPVVQNEPAPVFEETPAKAMPLVELSNANEQRADLWLTLLRSQLGLPLEKVSTVCEAMDSELQFVESNLHGNWFVCGQDEGGYTIVVDNDGQVIYVADGNFPFTLNLLTKLLGEPDAKRHIESLTQYKWIVTDGKLTRVVSLNLISDGEEEASFVSACSPEIDFLGLVGTIDTEEAPTTPAGTLNL